MVRFDGKWATSRPGGEERHMMEAVRIAAAGLALVASAGIANAIPLFDSASFGTGVYVGSPPGGHYSLQGTTPFHRLSTETVVDDASTFLYEARARADFQGFEVGAAAFAGADASHPYVFSVGGARAYTGLTVSTDTPVQLTGSITLDGTFQADPANDSAILSLFALDINGNYLFDVELEANATGVVDVCNPPGSCTNRTLLTSRDVWSLTVPFVLPTRVNTGIAVFLESYAVDQTLDSKVVGSNFFDTATLTFTPPPGVTVTLATGQTFAAAVPEPGTMALLAVGLAILAAFARSRASEFGPPVAGESD
jgi:hypothetical protein